ncbi:hypothetical protein AHAS_Ahas18G0155900 [Arachis hypogaea]
MKGNSVSGMNYYACLSMLSLVILTPFAIVVEGPQMWAAGWQTALSQIGPQFICSLIKILETEFECLPGYMKGLATWENNLHELWALLNFLLSEIFSSAETFDEWFQISGKMVLLDKLLPKLKGSFAGETVTNIHHWNVGHTSFQYKTWSVTLHFLFMKLSPSNQFQLLKIKGVNKDAVAVVGSMLELDGSYTTKPDKALELGIINSRHEAFITSKLWCNNDHHDLVLPALKTTLKKLGLDYLDLYLIHMPVRLKPEVDRVLEIGKDDLLPFDIEGTWEAMEECQRLGLAKFIGKGIHLAAWSPFSSKVTDIGIHFLKGLQNLALLNLEGYFVTAACLDTLAELPALSNLNISRCNFTNNGCEMFSFVANSPPTERDYRRPPIHVIVICPTRELASQATTEAAELLKYHPTIGVQVVIGGTRLAIQ